MRKLPDTDLARTFRAWKQQLLDAGDTIPDETRWALIGELFETLERLRVQAVSRPRTGQPLSTASDDIRASTIPVLRGWKAIATHLQVSRETAQIWRDKYAAADPLPFSQPGGRNGPVFAYSEQLDAWLMRRADDPPGSDRRPPFEPPPRARRVVMINGKPR